MSFQAKNIGRSDFAITIRNMIDDLGGVDSIVEQIDGEGARKMIIAADAAATKGFVSYRLYFTALGTMYHHGILDGDYSFVQYQRDAMRTSILTTDEDHLSYGVLNTASEAGEIAGKFAKSLRDNTELDPEAIVKEAGDVLWSLAALAKGLGVTLEDIAIMNVDKLRKRQSADTIGGSGDDR